jgi:hypothetical protein
MFQLQIPVINLKHIAWIIVHSFPSHSVNPQVASAPSPCSPHWLCIQYCFLSVQRNTVVHVKQC